MGLQAMTHFSPLNDRDAIFAIVPVEHKPPANSIMHGSMSAVLERVADSKARSEATALIRRAADAAVELKAQQEREQAAVETGVRKIADGILKLTHRLDQLEQERETRRALDAATEVTQQMLAIPKDAPDPEAPADETHVPSGELHDVAAKEEEQLAVRDQGDLPEELLEGAPPEFGNYPTLEADARPARGRIKRAPPRQYPQVAVSLNEV
jgi:hypothetical protein